MPRGKGPKKGEGGRPLIIIDWELAKKLAHIQCTAVEIAATLGVDDDTLVSACKRENKLTFSEWYKKHSENGKCSLRRSMWKMATNERPNTAMAIWLSKNYLGMRDNVDHNVDIKPLTFAYSLESNAE
jgi:hypothetical protein